MKKKNLLFIFTDEQTRQTLKAYGNTWMDSPNLDALAQQSVLFDRTYVSQPVCTASRATIMTGLTPHSAKMTVNNMSMSTQTPCLVELADFSDYQKAYIGKWHLGDEIFCQHGFDEWISLEDNYRNYYSEGRDKMQPSSYAKWLEEKGVQPDKTLDDGFRLYSRNFCAKELPREFGKAEFIAQSACAFLQRNQDNPFICYVNFLEPHMPFFGPLDDCYDRKSVPLPPNYAFPDEKEPQRLQNMARRYYEYGHNGVELKTDEDWKDTRARYAGLVKLVDDAVGKILGQLRALDLEENTIVVFTSDHGDMMGSHRLLAKTVLYEEATCVPLMMRIPGWESRRVQEPIGQVDLVPTLLELLGKKVPDGLEGQSWVHHLQDGAALACEDVFMEWHSDAGHTFGAVVGELTPQQTAREKLDDDIRSVVTKDGWKFNWSKGDASQLFNLHADPYEMRNLAQDPQYQALIQKLKEKILNWCRRTNDAVWLAWMQEQC